MLFRSNPRNALHDRDLIRVDLKVMSDWVFEHNDASVEGRVVKEKLGGSGRRTKSGGK